MAENLLIQPLVLDPADFPPLPLQPGFAQLVSDELGDQGTPADGFDDIVGEAIALVDVLDSALGGLGFELLDAFAEADLIDPTPVGDTVAGFTKSLEASSTAVDELGKLLSGAAPPTPSAGGGTGLPAGCAAVVGFDDVTNTPPIMRSVSFSAQGPNTVTTIDSVTLDQDTPGLFTVNTSALGQQPPNTALILTITLTATATQGVHGKITTKYHLQDNVARSLVLCLGVGMADNFPQAGGGGGTPPIRIRPQPPTPEPNPASA
jgi:hypothetical protein